VHELKEALKPQSNSISTKDLYNKIVAVKPYGIAKPLVESYNELLDCSNSSDNSNSLPKTQAKAPVKAQALHSHRDPIKKADIIPDLEEEYTENKEEPIEDKLLDLEDELAAIDESDKSSTEIQISSTVTRSTLALSVPYTETKAVNKKDNKVDLFAWAAIAFKKGFGDKNVLGINYVVDFYNKKIEPPAAAVATINQIETWDKKHPNESDNTIYTDLFNLLRNKDLKELSKKGNWKNLGSVPPYLAQQFPDVKAFLPDPIINIVLTNFYMNSVRAGIKSKAPDPNRNYCYADIYNFKRCFYTLLLTDRFNSYKENRHIILLDNLKAQNPNLIQMNVYDASVALKTFRRFCISNAPKLDYCYYDWLCNNVFNPLTNKIEELEKVDPPKAAILKEGLQDIIFSVCCELCLQIKSLKESQKGINKKLDKNTKAALLSAANKRTLIELVKSVNTILLDKLNTLANNEGIKKHRNQISQFFNFNTKTHDFIKSIIDQGNKIQESIDPPLVQANTK
jgi:hypothetical protein